MNRSLIDSEDMKFTKKISSKTWKLSFPLTIALLFVFHNALSIPGTLPKLPIQEKPVQQAKIGPSPEVLQATLRRENMNRILSRFHTGLHLAEERKLVAFITQESRSYGFDPELIMALISTESSFYNWSFSKKGAMGMMQIVPETGKALAKSTRILWNGKAPSLFDPYMNIRLGIHYLHALKKRFGDIHIALAAYNFGPTKVRRWVRQGKRIPRRYANKVMRSYKSYLVSEASESKAAAIIETRNDT